MTDDMKESKPKIITNIIHANTFLSRLKGLMGRKTLPHDTGLLLEPCDNVHTFHMKFSIDVIFLNQENNVMHIEHSMKPNQVGKKVKGAAKVLEINGGIAAAMNLQLGDVVDLVPRGEKRHETKNKRKKKRVFTDL